MGCDDDLQIVAEHELLQLQHEKLLHPWMQARFDLVDQDEGAVQLRDLERQLQDGAFSGDHVQLGIGGSGVLFCEPEILFPAGQTDDVGVAERKYLQLEVELGGRQRRLLGCVLEMRHLEHAADLQRIAEIGERTELDGTLGLSRALASEKASNPACDPSPAHGASTVRCRVLELDGDRLSSVVADAVPGTIPGKESGGYEILHAGPGDSVGTGGSKQHCGFAAGVAAGDDAHRVVERHLQLSDAPDTVETDLVEEIRHAPFLCLKSQPQLSELPVDHDGLSFLRI